VNGRDYNRLSEFSILYIEDELDLLEHTTEIIEDFVKIVYPVQNTKEAYGVIKTKKVDVIISDIMLKDENGIEFLKKIKKEYNLEIPAILTTAFTDTEYLLDAIKLKIENYIVKPINVKELLNSLHDTLLPKIQRKEINQTYNIIKTISAITDSKQVEVIKFIIKNLDSENMFNYSYSEIMDRVDISKPTLIKLFKQLSDLHILVKIQNKKHQFNENNLPMLG
jgi:DNA-binding NtrC family response regulator